MVGRDPGFAISQFAAGSSGGDGVGETRGGLTRRELEQRGPGWGFCPEPEQRPVELEQQRRLPLRRPRSERDIVARSDGHIRPVGTAGSFPSPQAAPRH